MAKITFTTEKDICNCNPELVSKLRNVTQQKELNDLIDQYDKNEVEDAMFAIAADEGTYYGYLNDEDIIELLWDHYDEYIFDDYICDSFLKRHTQENETDK